MALGQSIRNAIGSVWRVAVSAAAAGQSAYNTIRGGLAAAGETIAAPLSIDLTTQQQIASMAQGMEAARQALGTAPAESPITGDMIALAPWSMDLNAFNAAPAYDFQIGYRIPGAPDVQYRILGGVTSLPASVGDAIELAAANAAALAGPEGRSPSLGDISAAVVDSVTITVASPL